MLMLNQRQVSEPRSPQEGISSFGLSYLCPKRFCLGQNAIWTLTTQRIIPFLRIRNVRQMQKSKRSAGCPAILASMYPPRAKGRSPGLYRSAASPAARRLGPTNRRISSWIFSRYSEHPLIGFTRPAEPLMPAPSARLCAPIDGTLTKAIPNTSDNLLVSMV